MQKYKDDPLLFINTFLRKAHEPYVSEEEYRKVARGKPKIYDLEWQVRVRKHFFENQDKDQEHDNQEKKPNST